MKLKMQLIAQQKPLTLAVSLGDEQSLYKPIVEAVNFVRASQDSAQILINGRFNEVNLDDTKIILDFIPLILKNLEVEGETLYLKNLKRVSENFYIVTITITTSIKN